MARGVMAPHTEQVFASRSLEAYNGGVQNATARREPPVAWPKLGKEFDMSDDTPRRPISKALRFAVLERDEFRCQYCGATPKNGALEVDHIIPVSKGGETSAENLITSCEPCNKGKSNKHVKAAPVPDMADMAAEYEAKRKAIEKWRREYTRMCQVIASAVAELRRSVSVAEHVLASAIREYGVDEVAYAVEAVQVKGIPRVEYENQTKYLYGVLRNRAGQGYEAPRKAAIPRSSCPFDFAICARDQACGRDVDDGKSYTACTALIEHMGGWSAQWEEQAAVVEYVTGFVSVWRDSGVAALDWLIDNNPDDAMSCGHDDGLRQGMLRGIHLALSDPSDKRVVAVAKRMAGSDAS